MSVSPANNLLGHGFYQFSPELFYSVFTHDQGYELCRVVLYEKGSKEPIYAVRSPVEVRSRVTLINRQPTYIAVLARRTEIMTPFVTPPQQSDYMAQWNASKGNDDRPQVVTARGGLVGLLKPFVPGPIKRLIGRITAPPDLPVGFVGQFYRPMTLKEITFPNPVTPERAP